MHRLLVALLACLLAPAAYAIDRYVATTGNDAANDCTNPLAPCLTLQHAIDQAVAADTVNVVSGTYPVAGLVTVNKQLTLRGAQAGVDARDRVAAESILTNTQGISVAASTRPGTCWARRSWRSCAPVPGWSTPAVAR